MTQIAQRDPPTLKVLRQHRFALHVDQIAMQLDVIVRSRAHKRAHRAAHVQLLLQLASQRLPIALACVHFAPRKLPKTAPRLLQRTLRHEDTTVSKRHGPNDADKWASTPFVRACLPIFGQGQALET